jgi:hypothetical protein
LRKSVRIDLETETAGRKQKKTPTGSPGVRYEVGTTSRKSLFRKTMQATETITRRLRRELDSLRPRRIDLDATDSAAMRAECQRLNDKWDREGLGLNDFRIPESGPLKFHRVPLRLDCPETRFVRWDDYEQLQVLSATCFTPEPK